MPVADEFPPDDPQARWDQFTAALFAPEVVASQNVMDHAFLDFLEAHDGGVEPHCDSGATCQMPAVVALFCRHTGPNLLYGLVCGSHYELIRAKRHVGCGICNHVGKPHDLWRFQFIFTGSERRP